MYCKLIQWRLACHLDNNIMPAGSLSRHLQKCTVCRQQYQKMRQISENLKIHDPDLPNIEEEQLRNKIIARLPIETSRIYAHRSSAWRLSLIPATGLAAVLLITTALLWVQWIRPLKPAQPTPADLARFNQLMNTNIDALSGTLIQKSMQQSLETELNNLTHDMGKAVRFFTTCLPDA